MTWDNWLFLGVGLFVGLVAGVTLIAVLSAGKQADKDNELAEYLIDIRNKIDGRRNE
jgi:uncharacterized membrane-anchored protein YhcB (DUF1043 family)